MTEEEEDFDFSTEEEDSSNGSGDTEDEEESSPHATSMVRSTDRAMAQLKIFTEDLQI